MKMLFVNQRNDDQGGTKVTVTGLDAVNKPMLASMLDNGCNEVNIPGIFNGAIGLGSEYTPMQSWQWDGLLEHVLNVK